MPKKITSSLIAGLTGLTLGSTAMAGPYDGAPRQCFGRVALPPVEVSRSRQVLEAPGHVERRYVPAQVAHGWRRVLMRPAHVERLPTPAIYRTSYTRVTTPGPRRWVREPARYAVRTAPVLVSSGRWAWERRNGAFASGPAQPGQTLVAPTGLVMCRVWCPARYGETRQSVEVAPARRYSVATTRERWIAHRVMVRPAGVVERRIAAVYETTPARHLITPAHVEEARIAPRYGVVQDRRITAGGEGWSPVVCGGPLSRPALARMQASLTAQGYDAGPPDGQERPQTYAALRRFQIDRRMAARQITTDSARALGVIP